MVAHQLQKFGLVLSLLPALLLAPTQVRLLLGEIPERTEFSAPAVAAPLAPYLELTAAVRSGDLAAFQQVGAGAGVAAAGELSVW
jgi:hypothetical protein